MKTLATTAFAALTALLMWSVLAIAEPKADPAKGQYATEADAKSQCAADTVVWVNFRSKVIHHSTSRSYGKTKRGAYMCEKEAIKAGFRLPKARTPAKKA
jgi:hypothetical protein